MTLDERLADFSACYRDAVHARRQLLIARDPAKRRPGEARDDVLLRALAGWGAMDPTMGEGEA